MVLLPAGVRVWAGIAWFRFKNVGNTCYVNACVQVLLGLPFFEHDLCSATLRRVLDYTPDGQPLCRALVHVAEQSARRQVCYKAALPCTCFACRMFVFWHRADLITNPQSWLGLVNAHKFRHPPMFLSWVPPAVVAPFCQCFPCVNLSPSSYSRAPGAAYRPPLLSLFLGLRVTSCRLIFVHLARCPTWCPTGTQGQDCVPHGCF